MEEFSRGFGIRILLVSISLGTKFQQNRLGASGRQRVCGRESMSQPSLPCKVYDEIGIGLLLLG